LHVYEKWHLAFHKAYSLPQTYKSFLFEPVFQCVFQVDRERGLILVEIWPGVSIHEIQVETGCQFTVSNQYAFEVLDI
jgi:hypothetical protein